MSKQLGRKRTREVLDRFALHRWHVECDTHIRVMEKLTIASPGARAKWHVGQIAYRVDQLGQLLATAPKGTEASVKAYRVRVALTGL